VGVGQANLHGAEGSRLGAMRVVIARWSGPMPEASLPSRKVRPSHLPKVNYVPRIVGFGLVLVIVGSVLITQNAPLFRWGVLLLIGLAWPHIAYLRARRSAEQKRAEYLNMYVDAFLCGTLITSVQFRIWPGFLMLSGLCINDLAAGGVRLFLKGLGFVFLGIVFAALYTPVRFEPASSQVTVTLSAFGVLAYVVALGYYFNREARDLVRLKRILQDKNAELEEAHRKLRVAQADLIQSERMAALGKLAESVAHQVRNPAATIGGFAHRLQKTGGLDADAATAVEVILAEAKRLERIVVAVRDLTELPPPNRQPVAVEQVLDWVIQETREALPQVDMKKQVEPGLPDALADGALLRRAFLEVIANAGRAMPRGGEIVLAAYRQEDLIGVDIQDYGEGIAPNDLPQVFDPFFSTDPSASGLGLTIANRIISDLQGKIEIQSEVGIGTRVRIWLPTVSRLRPAEILRSLSH